MLIIDAKNWDCQLLVTLLYSSRIYVLRDVKLGNMLRLPGDYSQIRVVKRWLTLISNNILDVVAYWAVQTRGETQRSASLGVVLFHANGTIG